ncbi:hypothetical protein PVAG01_11070 [Phlyctema vagabunda]|uniref:Homeobox domain-containing protein n=1 Tax=Phlyctema vagabunda TaxID=108571 RepID=A0ABR4P427_9HELO
MATHSHPSSSSLGSAIKNAKMMDNDNPTKYARFDKDQAHILEQHALQSDTPNEVIIQQLARQFQVPVKKVADWFVNYRYRRGSKAKEKKVSSGDDQSTRDGSLEAESAQGESKARRFAKLTKVQVKVLELELVNGDSPSRATRERLAVEVDAPVQKVSEWYSNRKQRMKKRALEDSMVASPNPKRIASGNHNNNSNANMNSNLNNVNPMGMSMNNMNMGMNMNMNMGSGSTGRVTTDRNMGRSLRSDRAVPLVPAPALQLPPHGNEAAMVRFLRDIEDNIARLKHLRQGVIANSDGR